MSETRHEHAATAVSGWLFLPVWIALFAGALWQVFGNIFINNQPPAISGFAALPVLVFLAKGFVILPPNIGAVLGLRIQASAASVSGNRICRDL